MVFDLKACIGCNACVVGCKQENSLPDGVFFTKTLSEEYGVFPAVNRVYIPTICNHCDDAPCEKVCPSGATYTREDGIVMVDDAKCIGCSTCAVACPYDQRTMMEEESFRKGLFGTGELTPFELDDGRWILVNRGWLPLAPDRQVLPTVPTRSNSQVIGGKLDELYQPGRRIGAPDTVGQDHWPQLLTYPDMDDVAFALGTTLYPLTLLLDEAHSDGFKGRNWKPVNTGAAKHQARALQWFTFVIAALVIWVFLGFRRGSTP